MDVNNSSRAPSERVMFKLGFRQRLLYNLRQGADMFGGLPAGVVVLLVINFAVGPPSGDVMAAVIDAMEVIAVAALCLAALLLVASAISESTGRVIVDADGIEASDWVVAARHLKWAEIREVRKARIGKLDVLQLSTPGNRGTVNIAYKMLPASFAGVVATHAGTAHPLAAALKWMREADTPRLSRRAG